MAIVVDPDLLNRNEIIFGTTGQDISAFPVGAVVSGIYDPEAADGVTVSGLLFTSDTGDFVDAKVAINDILSIKTGADAGHWQITSIVDPSSLQVQSLDADGPLNWVDFVTGSGLVYDVRDPTGGNMADGATEQAIYSFSKEEWRVDGELFGGDDLIRHEFPFEPLTIESFEIGGGTSHDEWDWFTEDTKFRVRTGGWDTVNLSSTKEQTYAGILTLGALDADTQVYYQPSGVNADPVNFVLTGTVNQAILVHDVFGQVTTSGFDTRAFLKIFARKKKRTYAQSEIADIGVTSLVNIVNRFPLTHVVDPAIVADDAEIEGHDPFTNFSIPDTNTNGVTLDVDGNTGTLTSAGENFLTSGINPGGVVEITGGTNDNGFFIIVSVNSDTELTLNTVEHGAFTGEASLTFETHTRRIYGPIVDDGAITELVTPGSGLLNSIQGDFIASGVAIGDILRITEPASGFEGVYKIVNRNNDAEIAVNTRDQVFPSGTANVIDYQILEPGMYLQSKDNDVPLTATTSLTFADANPDTITRTAGDWITDGVEEGDVVTITGAAFTANNGSFVIRTVGATVLTLDVQHTLTAEGPVSATATVARHFVREINSIKYPFLWRTFGNAATIAKVFEFIQRELRRTTDIDNGPDIHRGDVTDLLMEFATPTGKTLNMFIDNFDANDTNNISFVDAGGVTRNFSFIAAGNITHNANLVNDLGPAVVTMFFASTPQGAFGTSNAIVVQDDTGAGITYSVAGASRAFTFDYDNNVQGGRTAGTDAAIVLVAIGLETAQYVLLTGTITRATGQTFGLISSLERTYSNP